MALARHKTIHRLGWVFLLIFSVAIHTRAVLIAARVPDTGGALSTALLPVISWFQLALSLPDEFSEVRRAFAISLLAWLVSASLLVTVRRFNRELRRTDRPR